MPRAMSSDMLAAVKASELQPALFVEAYFVTGPIHVWSGYGTIQWNGHAWAGIGTLGGVSTIEDGASVEAKGITLTMSGIDPALIADVLGEFQLGAPVTVWLGLFSAGALITSPIVSWAGRMDQPSIEVGGNTAIISINCENRLLDMNISVYRRYTNDDQQLDHPGDRGLEFVSGIQEVTIYWGKTPNSANNI